MRCSICKSEIMGFGNNPAPLKRGDVCDKCNLLIVVPLRIYLGSDKNTKALVLTAGDNVSFIEPIDGKITLNQLQDGVGGFIEFYPIKDDDFAFIVNEEGLFNGLSVNKFAYEVFNIKVVGNLLVVPRIFMEED